MKAQIISDKKEKVTMQFKDDIGDKNKRDCYKSESARNKKPVFSINYETAEKSLRNGLQHRYKRYLFLCLLYLVFIFKNYNYFIILCLIIKKILKRQAHVFK